MNFELKQQFGQELEQLTKYIHEVGPITDNKQMLRRDDYVIQHLSNLTALYLELLQTNTYFTNNECRFICEVVLLMYDSFRLGGYIDELSSRLKRCLIELSWVQTE